MGQRHPLHAAAPRGAAQFLAVMAAWVEGAARRIDHIVRLERPEDLEVPREVRGGAEQGIGRQHRRNQAIGGQPRQPRANIGAAREDLQRVDPGRVAEPFRQRTADQVRAPLGDRDNGARAGQGLGIGPLGVGMGGKGVQGRHGP